MLRCYAVLGFNIWSLSFVAFLCVNFQFSSKSIINSPHRKFRYVSFWLSGKLFCILPINFYFGACFPSKSAYTQITPTSLHYLQAVNSCSDALNAPSTTDEQIDLRPASDNSKQPIRYLNFFIQNKICFLFLFCYPNTSETLLSSLRLNNFKWSFLI